MYTNTDPLIAYHTSTIRGLEAECEAIAMGALSTIPSTDAEGRLYTIEVRVYVAVAP